MTTAYRNDLDAARARVTDLEREAELLRKRNAELTARAPENVAPREPAAPIAADTPAPSDLDRTMAGLARVCVGMAVFALGVRKYHSATPHPGWAAIALGLGFVFWWFSGFQPLWRTRRQR